VIAICAYPLVRRLTRRLEHLQAGVESLGAGELSARVKVEGKDEVARLAESFNSAAARIEQLVSAHKMLLANTSHELRTPLARIRLGTDGKPWYRISVPMRPNGMKGWIPARRHITYVVSARTQIKIVKLTKARPIPFSVPPALPHGKLTTSMIGPLCVADKHSFKRDKLKS